MCSPIGHSLAGASFWLNQSKPSLNWNVITLVVIGSNLPDIDFLFGYLIGSPNRYHHLWTHSLFFSLIAGLVWGGIQWMRNRRFALRPILIMAGIVLTHILTDWLTLDTEPPVGIQLFWPFSSDFFISSFQPFGDLVRAESSGAFFQSLFCMHNFKTVIREILILGPVAIGFFIKNHYSLYSRSVSSEKV